MSGAHIYEWLTRTRAACCSTARLTNDDDLWTDLYKVVDEGASNNVIQNARVNNIRRPMFAATACLTTSVK
jgi:hypothetical protein